MVVIFKSLRRCSERFYFLYGSSASELNWEVKKSHIHLLLHMSGM